MFSHSLRHMCTIYIMLPPFRRAISHRATQLTKYSRRTDINSCFFGGRDGREGLTVKVFLHDGPLKSAQRWNYCRRSRRGRRGTTDRSEAVGFWNMTNARALSMDKFCLYGELCANIFSTRRHNVGLWWGETSRSKRSAHRAVISVRIYMYMYISYIYMRGKKQRA